MLPSTLGNRTLAAWLATRVASHGLREGFELLPLGPIIETENFRTT